MYDNRAGDKISLTIMLHPGVLPPTGAGAVMNRRLSVSNSVALAEANPCPLPSYNLTPPTVSPQYICINNPTNHKHITTSVLWELLKNVQTNKTDKLK